MQEQIFTLDPLALSNDEAHRRYCVSKDLAGESWRDMKME